MKKSALNRPLAAVLTLALLCAVLLAGCQQQGSVPAVRDVSILHEPEFGGVYITKTIEEFNPLGFAYGDSVDVAFSNGYTLEDLPYYNGYYVDPGRPLLVAYPGYDYVKAAINITDDLWAVAGLEAADTASITLRSRGTYLDIQNARNIQYLDERERYDSDEMFANFRCIRVGDLAPDRLYRAASPCDNQHRRAPFTDALMERAGVQTILNLADTDEKLRGYLAREDFASPAFRALYDQGRVLPLALTANYGGTEFRQKLAAGLTQMTDLPGPYLVHCTEGKDRTGFVCLLLEALCGAAYEEMRDDYMLTYANYYRIDETSDPARYRTLVESVFNPMVALLIGDADPTRADLAAGARDYLLSGGMTETQIAALRQALTAP